MNPEVIDCIRQAGDVLLQHFGQVRGIRIKDSRSSIVTDADLESDRLISGFLSRRFPEDNLLTEESGFLNRGSRRTWVVDPLDGTSNYAAGIPWFGVMIARLDDGVPTAGAMYLPVDGVLYVASRGKGSFRNGAPIRLDPDRRLEDALCGFGLDGSADAHEVARQAGTLARLVQAVRNIRATNSLVDFTLTLDGHLGACVNFHTMIWDIAAPCLLFREAGGAMTDHAGREITFSLGPDACARSYAVAAAGLPLHRELIPWLASP